jgi:hypothetical protein
MFPRRLRVDRRDVHGVLKRNEEGGDVREEQEEENADEPEQADRLF